MSGKRRLYEIAPMEQHLEPHSKRAKKQRHEEKSTSPPPPSSPPPSSPPSPSSLPSPSTAQSHLSPPMADGFAKGMEELVKLLGEDAANKMLAALLGSAPPPPKKPITWHAAATSYDNWDLFKTPWIERDSFPVGDIWSTLRLSLHSFMQQSATGRDYLALVISGGSGTGKTRSGYQLGPLLTRYLYPYGWSYIRYCLSVDNSPTTPMDTHNWPRPTTDKEAQLEAEKWLKRSLASHHNVPDGDQLSWPELLTGIRSSGDFDRNDRKSTPQATTSSSSTSSTPPPPILLLVQIDEFQFNINKCIHLVRQLSTLLRTTRVFHEHGVYIVPVFTGTWIGSLALATEYKTRQYMLSGLDSLEDARQFFDEHLKLHDGKSQLSKLDENAIIGHLGYIPRMIDIFCQVISSVNPRSFAQAFAPVRSSVHQEYPTSDFSPMERNHICLLSYFKIPVRSDYRLNGHSVLDAMASGTLFLSATAGAADAYIVVLPTIFLLQWLPQHFEREVFINPNDQADEHTLPILSMELHCATYSMLRIWAATQDELKIPPPTTSKPALAALCGAHSSLPALKFRRAQPNLLWATVNLKLIYAGAIEGATTAIEGEFEICVNDGETIGPTPIIANDPSQSTPTHPLSLTAPRDSAADAVTPHGVAEQYKSDLHFNRSGIAKAKYSCTDLNDELCKHTYGRPYLAFISPAQVSATIDPKKGVILQVKTERDKKRGRPSAASTTQALVGNLLLVRGAANIYTFARGFLHGSMWIELNRAAKIVFRTSHPTSNASSSSAPT